jgi:hypothetical protein
MQMFKPDSSSAGGASGTGKNYLSSYNNNPGNGDFEAASTTGFSLGTTGTLTNNLPTGSPTFGSGASGNLSLTLISSGQLAGTYSAGYVSSAATTAGNMLASSAFTIDKEDQAKRLSISIAYLAQTNPSNANWSGTSSNSLACAIYDVTNSAWIIPDTPFNFKQSAGVGQFSASFQTSSNGTSYRLVIYNANATSGAVTVYFDDFTVGPSQFSASNSPIVATYYSSASATASTTIPINYDTKIVDTAATVTTGTWKFTAPVSGLYHVDHGAYVSGNAFFTVYKNGVAFQSLGNSTTGFGLGTGGTVVLLNAGDTIDIRPNASGTVGGGTITSGLASWISIFLLQASAAGPAGQVVAASAHFTGSSVTNATQANFDTVDLDTAGGITTGASWKYTAQISGNYFVESSLFSSGTNFAYSVYKNGSLYRAIGISNSASGPCAGGTIVPLNAGDTIDIRPNATATLTGLTGPTLAQTNYINIFLLQGPSAANSSNATVAASYWLSANFAASTTVPINFDSKEFDTANAVTTSATAWKFTVPVTGLYSVEAFGPSTAAGAVRLVLYKNGSAYKAMAQENANYGVLSGNTLVQLNAGDFIDFRPDSALTFVGGTLATGTTANMSIMKVG